MRLYVIDRLVASSGFSSRQCVERLGQSTRKRDALRAARAAARRHEGAWIQVSVGNAIIATFEGQSTGWVRKV